MNNHTIPDGVYYAKIIKANFDAVSKNGKALWQFTLQLSGVKATLLHNIVVDDSIPQAWVAGWIAKMAECFSVPEGSEDYLDWVNTVGIIEITHKEYNGVDYPRPKFYKPEAGKKTLAQFKAAKDAEHAAQIEFEEFSREAGVPEEDLPRSKQTAKDFQFADDFKAFDPDEITF